MNTSLPALSLRQPWAWAILHAGKTIENRTWGTHYRGRIRLHAAKTWDTDGWSWLLEHGFHACPLPRYFQRDGMLGAYVGEVDIIGCFRFDPGCVPCGLQHEAPYRWAFGPVCWKLENPEAYSEPIPGRGYPGLYLPERFEGRAGRR